MLVVDCGLEVCDFGGAGAGILEGEDDGGCVCYVEVEVDAWVVLVCST